MIGGERSWRVEHPILIKLQLGALVGTLIIVIIEFFITKVIKILNFNCVLVLGVSSKGFKN